jgi:3-hydroxy-9,10-secoandrosta-1,3,5(10)-triene-9,17-dione monooxygenase
MITPDIARERAAALVPALADRAEHCEAIRRCPEETLDELYETGLMQLMQPRRYGGSELNMDCASDVAMVLAGGCASTAWVWMNLATHSWNIGQFSQEAQEDVWDADARAVAATGLQYPCGQARRVPSGFRLSGRWPFASGVDGASWMIVGAQVDGTTERLMLLVPKSDYQSLQNWRTFGLAGTGSHDVEIRDVFVPAHRTVRPELLAAGREAPGALLNDSPVYRLPAYSGFGFALASVPIGAARAALDRFTATARSRATTAAASRMAELVPVQLRVAEASASMSFAETGYQANLRELVRLTEEGGPIDHDVKLRWKRDVAFAVGLSKRCVETLMTAGGGNALSTASPLQRSFRDVVAASSHIGLTWDLQASLYGRYAMGLPLGDDLLI